MNEIEEFLQEAEQCETDIQAGRLLKSFERLIEKFDWITDQKIAFMNQDVLYFKYVLTTQTKTRVTFTLESGELTADYTKQDGIRNAIHLEQSNATDLDIIFK